MTFSGNKQEILEKRVGARVNTSAPTVSVVVPAYNVAEYVCETLESVFAQSFEDYEIILVNDGSPDTENLEKVLEKYFDQIVYIKQTNGGAATARNTAIKSARGRYLAFLDGDDVWLPAYLEKQLKALREKDCDLIYADAEFFGGAVASNHRSFMTSSPSNGAVTPESLILSECNVITSGTIVKREKVERVGGFSREAGLLRIEDYDLWFRLAKAGARLDYQKEILLKYRVRADGLSGSNVARAERNVAGLRFFAGKYDLTGREKAALESRLRLAEAELELELGKFCLASENFDAAVKHFRNADRYYGKLKLKIIVFLLTVRPRLAAHIFKRLRPAELALVKTAENQ